MRDAHNKMLLHEMQDEMDSLHANHIYELTELPEDKKAPRIQWIYTLTSEEGGNPPRFKGHILVKGFQKKEGVDFETNISPVMKMTSIQTVLSIVASIDLEVEQLNVKIAFLRGGLEDEIYVQQLHPFVPRDECVSFPSEYMEPIIGRLVA